MASLESDAHPNIKDAIVKSEDVCTVSLDHGEMLGRCLKNSYAQKYKEMAESGASFEELSAFHRDHSLYHTQITGDADGYEIMCGQGAGLIKSILSVDEIIGEIANNIPSAMEKCKEKLSVFEN